MAKKPVINPYDIKIMERFNECSMVSYITDETRHTESLYCDFSNENETVRYYFSENAAITSNWMELFGYGENELITSNDDSSPICLISAALTRILPRKGLTDPKTGRELIGAFTKDSFTEAATAALTTMASAFTDVPALCFCYPIFFDVIRDSILYYTTDSDKKPSKNLLYKYNALIFSVGTVLEFYDKVRSYVQNVLISPYMNGITLSPDSTAEHYKNYCDLYPDENEPYRDFYTRSTSQRNPNAGAFEISPADPGWEQYIKQQQNENSEGIKIYTLNQYAHIGISQLIRDGRCIRKCKLCGRYFKVRYSSSQECCTRMYKDTKFACNEYASRRSAKDRFFEHPIHAEYNKAYNRLYARIRRGKVPKDTQLTTQLKALHDEYYERYEHTHKKIREQVWREYIEKNKELLS